jgi:putative cell wall-binding protein
MRRRPAAGAVIAALAVNALAALPSAAAAPTVTRYAGADRFQTAAEVSAATFSPPVPVAFVATADAFTDALAAVPAAAVDGGPVLLVTGTAIPQATAAELTRVKPAKIVVLGGPATIADSVVVSLQAYTTGSVTRIAGPDRYATAADVSAATFAPRVNAVYIVSDAGFADVLVAGAVAANVKAPILVVSPDGIPAATAQELTRLSPASIVVVGGPFAVSEKVAGLLAQSSAGSVTRVAGDDRYGTSVAVSQTAFPTTAAAVYLATGANFPDALTGGVAAGLAPAPILLVTAACVPASVSGEITRLNPSKVIILGGDLAVGPAVDSLTPCAGP